MAAAWISAERRRSIPLIAAAAAVVLVLAGLAVAAYNEGVFRAQAAREAQVQADILAASVTAALAFNDKAAAGEYISALRVNSQIEAAGIYGADGDLIAAYRRGPAEVLPRRPAVGRSPYEGDHIVVLAPVTQGSATLGSIYLRTEDEPLARRALRYVAIGLLGVMAALVVAVLAATNGAQRRAYRALTEANEALRLQIEQREKAEEALRQSQKMEAIGQLTGGVAHDFNNLLMVASSGLDLLNRTQDPKRREVLEQGIRHAIDRGARLTRQLLAFSRRNPLKSEVVDLGHQIEGMRLLLDRSLREDINVRIEIAPHLWPVEIDPAQLEVAVLNIAVNARDAMPDGGVISVRARNRPEVADDALRGEFVELSLSDTGRGMTPAMMSRVFEPFFTTKEVGKGTGLGLSQVYGFMRASGGDVRVSSAPGEGTTLSLLFPRSDKALETPAPAPTPATAEATPSGGRLLLVEDDDAVAAAVGGMLSEIGYSFDRAPTADAALEVLQADATFDLVLSDMVMPGKLDGISLAREIRRRFPHLPVVLTTGFSEAADMAARDGLRLLAKPYGLDALAHELAAALAERR
jgi:signal transduction histidine kinase/CheY-like chemotaxis protein